MNAPCGQEDCGHTIERLEARLDCGKDADCADEVETQEQCKKHYVIYMEAEAGKAEHDLVEVRALARSALECAANDRSAAFQAREERNHYKALSAKYMAADFARAATEEEKS